MLFSVHALIFEIMKLNLHNIIYENNTKNTFSEVLNSCEKIGANNVPLIRIKGLALKYVHLCLVELLPTHRTKFCMNKNILNDFLF